MIIEVPSVGAINTRDVRAVSEFDRQQTTEDDGAETIVRFSITLDGSEVPWEVATHVYKEVSRTSMYNTKYGWVRTALSREQVERARADLLKAWAAT